ncbi:DUF6262 family protein [Saccharopolyspora pogona]|uniref:DUF6262 family protein n=1 Tax=Saccharopolyspora pogona TaxID=333966 RepID=UPI001CC2502E|nr:DUF6262 family protein [Saccharopolyspora pogona]
MRPDNTAPIIAAAQRRRELTRAKALQALRELDRTGAPITFQSVAAAAEVSRSWLYAQPDIRAEIQRLREATRRAPAAPIPASQRTSEESALARLDIALKRNRELAEENQRLRRQLARALGEHRRSPHSRDPGDSPPPPAKPHRTSVTIGPC